MSRQSTSSPSTRKGRGAASNDTGRYEREKREAFDDGWSTLEEEAARPLRTSVSIEAARRIITRNQSPDIPFDRSINPYRGCEHGCSYCFARPTHAFLGLSPGLDFETRLTIKPNAAAMLRRELAHPRYRCRPIAIGTNTDPYQPIEKENGLMRQILEVLLEHRHPVTIVTKGALVTRDADLLAEFAALKLTKVALSVTTLDRALARKMEPRAATPERRLAAIEHLSRAGVPVGVMLAPVIPGLNDHEMEAVLDRAKDAGAEWAEFVTLRLPLEVSPLFQEWLAAAYPHRAARIMTLVRDTQGGRDYDPEWGRRQRGSGPVAQLIARRFSTYCKKLGLGLRREALRTDLFRAPSLADGQLSLDFSSSK